jgi:hypothetical protein
MCANPTAVATEMARRIYTFLDLFDEDPDGMCDAFAIILGDAMKDSLSVFSFDMINAIEAYCKVHELNIEDIKARGRLAVVYSGAAYLN